MQQRAVSLLARLDTERARLLLKGWASASPDSVLGTAAAQLHERKESD
jgi:hypothetical protein